MIGRSCIASSLRSRVGPAATRKDSSSPTCQNPSSPSRGTTPNALLAERPTGPDVGKDDNYDTRYEAWDKRVGNLLTKQEAATHG